MIKLITIDLDGTLLDKDKNITEANLEAIKKCTEKGVYVVRARGRPQLGTKSLIKKLGLFNSYIILYNGGKIIDIANNKTIYTNTISGSDIKEIYQLSIKNNLYYHAFKENEDLITQKFNPYTALEVRINHIPFKNELMKNINDNEKFLKGMIVGDEESLNKLEPKLPSSFKEKYSIVRSAKVFLEFLNKSVDKGNALNFLKDYLNLKDDETMAIGDAGNDLGMIKEAHIGVAMKNSMKNVLDIADYITENDNNNSGVAEAINKFVL